MIFVFSKRLPLWGIIKAYLESRRRFAMTARISKVWKKKTLHSTEGLTCLILCPRYDCIWFYALVCDSLSAGGHTSLYIHTHAPLHQVSERMIVWDADKPQVQFHCAWILIFEIFYRCRLWRKKRKFVYWVIRASGLVNTHWSCRIYKEVIQKSKRGKETRKSVKINRLCYAPFKGCRACSTHACTNNPHMRVQN